MCPPRSTKMVVYLLQGQSPLIQTGKHKHVTTGGLENKESEGLKTWVLTHTDNLPSWHARRMLGHGNVHFIGSCGFYHGSLPCRNRVTVSQCAQKRAGPLLSVALPPCLIMPFSPDLPIRRTSAQAPFGAGKVRLALTCPENLLL